MDHFTISNANSIHTIQSLKNRSAALLAQLRVLEKQVPRSNRRNRSSKNLCSSTSNTQIRKATLVAVLNDLDLQYYLIAFSVRECADSTAFD